MTGIGEGFLVRYRYIIFFFFTKLSEKLLYTKNHPQCVL